MQPERDQICQRSVARDLNHAKPFPLTLSTDYILEKPTLQTLKPLNL